MRGLLGWLLMLGGVVLGLYVGLWVCFIGGIIDIVDAFKAVEISGMAIGIGVLKIIFAAFSGWMSGLLLIVPGAVMAGLGEPRRRF